MSPIRPENRSRYPDDWPFIREKILARSRDGAREDTRSIVYPERCECTGMCGAHEHRCERRNHEPIPGTAFLDDSKPVVLTIAHLDHTPENNDPENLRAMCQRCHLRYDAPRKARERRARREAGTDRLFESAP